MTAQAAVFQRHPRRCDRAAVVARPRAAGMKLAPRRSGQKRRHLGGQGNAVLGAVRVGFRVGRQKRRRIGMGGRAEDGLRRARLDKPAQIHHRHPVGDMVHHMQVVGDDHHGQSQPFAQLIEQVENLALNRYIQPRRRFVGDDQHRVERDGPRHADAPRLPARKLVGIAIGIFERQPDKRQEPRRLILQIAALEAMNAQGFGDDIAHRHARRKRSDRILKHHRHAPPQRFHGLPVKPVDALPLEGDRARRNRL